MLRKGMDADLLLLDRNPLADIRNTRAIHAVMQGGRLYDRVSLDAMLEHVTKLTAEDPGISFHE